MRLTSIAIALLSVVATASAVTVETRDSANFPNCVNRCQPRHFGCLPYDWKCLCRKNDWQNWFKRCCRDNCRGNDYHGAGQAISRRCRKADHPWGW